MNNPAGAPDPTATLAALDAFAFIERPMMAAMQAAMISDMHYRSQLALCEAQRAAALENAEWERRMAALFRHPDKPRDTTP